MNDFSRKQLEKYGWSNGKGLGKREDGIVDPLKAKLKLNSHGVGFDSGEEFKFNWWENAFNTAAKNLSITNDKDGNVEFKCGKRVNVKIERKRPNKYAKKDLHLGTFVKSEILTTEGLKTCPDKAILPTSDSEESNDAEVFSQRLTEEELFIKCGGLTAHKGARHGLRMSGKLSRVEKQNEELLKMRENSRQEDSVIENMSVEKELPQENEAVATVKRNRGRKRKRNNDI